MSKALANGTLQQAGIANILRCCHRVESARSALADRELELNAAVNTHFETIGGSLREQAKILGFSAPYVHDVRNGRRQVSREFVMRLQEYANGTRPRKAS